MRRSVVWIALVGLVVPSAAESQQQSVFAGNVVITVEVTEACTQIQPSDVNLGSTKAGDSLWGLGSFGFTCSGSSGDGSGSAKLGFSSGNNSANNNRQLLGPYGEVIPYSITDTSGSTQLGDSGCGSATNGEQPLTLAFSGGQSTTAQFAVSANAALPTNQVVGTYTDTVVVTLCI